VIVRFWCVPAGSLKSIRESCSPFRAQAAHLIETRLSPPCLQLVCFYYVLTTFTTVGYGMLKSARSLQRVLFPEFYFHRRYFCFHARRAGECYRLAGFLCSKAAGSRVCRAVPAVSYESGLRLQVFCIFLFLCAASLFGTIIAQVNEIVASLTTKKKVLDSILETYLAIHPT
jgi:hypothetical protein